MMYKMVTGVYPTILNKTSDASNDSDKYESESSENFSEVDKFNIDNIKIDFTDMDQEHYISDSAKDMIKALLTIDH